MSQTEQTTQYDQYLEQADQMMDTITKEELAELLMNLDALNSQVEVPEAMGSCGAYIIGPGGTEVLVTSRGPSLEMAWGQLASFLRKRIGQGFRPVIKFKSNTQADATYINNGGVVTPETTTTSSATPQPAPVKTGFAGTGDSFAAEELKVTIDGDKKFFKVMGKPFTKFGVTVWPEVLQAAGFNPDALTGKVSLVGFTAFYEKKDDGNPKKITRLSR